MIAIPARNMRCFEYLTCLRRQQPRGSPPPAIARPLRILLAEDDSSVAAITQTMLSELRHEAICVPNAEQALRVLRSDAALDVLLTDMIMPGGMSGVELAPEAARIRPGLSILLCSVYAGESLDNSIAQGVWPFLKKPYLQSELAEALARLSPQSTSEESLAQTSRAVVE